MYEYCTKTRVLMVVVVEGLVRSQLTPPFTQHRLTPKQWLIPLDSPVSNQPLVYQSINLSIYQSINLSIYQSY